MVIELTWEDPPKGDDPSTPTREQIAEALAGDPGRWAVVGRHDRVARATSQFERINAGKEYGEGFAAQVRRVGPEHRVYARKLGRRRPRPSA